MEVEGAPPVVAPPSQIALNLLATIRTAQSQNGLKHGDYGRYRCGSCATGLQLLPDDRTMHRAWEARAPLMRRFARRTAVHAQRLTRTPPGYTVRAACGCCTRA